MRLMFIYNADGQDAIIDVERLVYVFAMQNQTMLEFEGTDKTLALPMGFMEFAGLLKSHLVGDYAGPERRQR